VKLNGDDEYKSDAVFDSVHNGVVRGASEKGWKKLETMDVGVEEAQRYLPKEFIDLYLELVYLGVDVGKTSAVDRKSVDIPGVGKGTDGLGNVRSETKEVRDVYRKIRLPTSGLSVPILSENAVRFRSSVDRKLRKITREIKSYLDGKTAPKVNRRCGQCKKFGDGDWSWCPFCRGRMEEISS